MDDYDKKIRESALASLPYINMKMAYEENSNKCSCGKPAINSLCKECEINLANKLIKETEEEWEKNPPVTMEEKTDNYVYYSIRCLDCDNKLNVIKSLKPHALNGKRFFEIYVSSSESDNPESAIISIDRLQQIIDDKLGE